MAFFKHRIYNSRVKYFINLFYILFKSYVTGYLLKSKSFFFNVKHQHLIPVLTIMKFNMVLLSTSLVDIVVVDYLSKQGNRFELNYVLWNYTYEIRFVVKVMVHAFANLLSTTLLYESGNWLEREIWDMYGIKFLFHPSLRRILTDYGFKGHPLRKDFPLIGYVEVAYDDSWQSIRVLPVEISQTLRFFQFNNLWSIKR